MRATRGMDGRRSDHCTHCHLRARTAEPCGSVLQCNLRRRRSTSRCPQLPFGRCARGLYSGSSAGPHGACVGAVGSDPLPGHVPQAGDLSLYLLTARRLGYEGRRLGYEGKGSSSSLARLHSPARLTVRSSLGPFFGRGSCLRCYARWTKDSKEFGPKPDI